MDVTASLRTELDAEVVRVVVRDLATYPYWLDIVSRVRPAADGGDARDACDPVEVWSVDLRGQIGPLRRAKRLRMERTVDTATEVRFERVEVDGRDHSAWALAAHVESTGSGSDLTMRLHYGGSLWLPLLDRLLRDEIERSKPRLVAHAARSV